MFSNYLTPQPQKYLENILQQLLKNTLKLKLNKKSYIIDIGSNDGVALKPFLDLGFKKVQVLNQQKIQPNLQINKIKTFNGFLEKKNLKKKKEC